MAYYIKMNKDTKKYLKELGLRTIVENRKLVCSLFHGTSCIFLDLIKKHGLGKINIIKQLDAVSFFQWCYQIADKNDNMKEDEKYIWGHFNTQLNPMFQHGYTYLSPSFNTAYNYANKKYGSEFITEALELYDRIKDKITHMPHHKLIRFTNEIEPKLLDQKLIVEIKNIEISSLLTEKGCPIEEEYLIKLEALFMQEQLKIIENENTNKGYTLPHYGKIISAEEFKHLDGLTLLIIDLNRVYNKAIEAMKRSPSFQQGFNFRLTEIVDFNDLIIHYFEAGNVA